VSHEYLIGVFWHPFHSSEAARYFTMLQWPNSGSTGNPLWSASLPGLRTSRAWERPSSEGHTTHFIQQQRDIWNADFEGCWATPVIKLWFRAVGISQEWPLGTESKSEDSHLYFRQH